MSFSAILFSDFVGPGGGWKSSSFGHGGHDQRGEGAHHGAWPRVALAEKGGKSLDRRGKNRIWELGTIVNLEFWKNFLSIIFFF